MRCEEGGDVQTCANQMIARFPELKVLSFDLDQCCVNILLNALPARFGSYLDNVWTSTENLSIESVKLAILPINAEQHARHHSYSFSNLITRPLLRTERISRLLHLAQAMGQET